MNSQPCRRPMTALLLSLAVLRLTGTVAIAQSPDLHDSIQRFLDAESVLVGWTDLRQINAESIQEFARSIDDRTARPDLTELETVRQALVQLGVTRVYVAPSLIHVVDGPQAVIVPAPENQLDSVALILRAVADGEGFTVVTDKGVVIAGDKDAVQRLQERQGEPTEELLTELRRVDASNGIVLGIFPSLSVTLTSVLLSQAGDDPDTFTQLVSQLPHLRSVSVATEFPPTASQVRITSDSDKSAGELAAALNGWLTKQLDDKSSALTLTASGKDVVRASESTEDSQAAVDAIRLLLKPAQAAADRQQSINNLKQIALALHNFHDVHLHFPAQALAADNGDRRLSWRVMILPWLDQAALYQRFRLDEPWDSEHNIRLLDEMPDVFRASDEGVRSGHTQYVAPITKNSLFGAPGSGVAIRDITDGTSNTLMVVETIPVNAVPWTKPVDLVVGDEDPLTAIAGSDKAFRACTCDGAAHRFPNGVPNELLRAMLTIDGGEVIDWDAIER